MVMVLSSSFEIITSCLKRVFKSEIEDQHPSQFNYLYEKDWRLILFLARLIYSPGILKCVEHSTPDKTVQQRNQMMKMDQALYIHQSVNPGMFNSGDCYS